MAQKTAMKPFAAKDLFVKVLATVFVNPMDRGQRGKKILIQDFLGCGCPDEVVEQATIRFFVRPLGSFLERRIASMAPRVAATPLEKDVNVLMKLPKGLTWPREQSGRIVVPEAWRRSMLEEVSKKTGHVEKLVFLRKMCSATIDAAIEVPGRAFFFLAAQERKRLQKAMLLVQYESGQLLYKLLGYNRCRLFTITESSESKIIPQIDTALSWQGLYNAFYQARDGYAFADHVLRLFDSGE